METAHSIKTVALGDLPRAEGAYLVGGTVRDLLLSRQPADYDLAVIGNPEVFGRRLLESTPGRLVVIGKPGQAVVRVVTAEKLFDICAINGRRIEEDLLARDFGINAMACCLSTGRLIDPAGGLQDLSAGRIRMVSRTVFKKDPVRLIRAYRMAAQLGFQIDRPTQAAITEEAHRLPKAAAERLRQELFKLLAGATAAACLADMNRSGLLTMLFPEMQALRGCPQPAAHRFDAFDHSLETVAQLEALLERPGPLFDRHRQAIEPMNEPTRAARLKCAALLHDIGKPLCRSLDSADRVHFYGHAARSAEMVSQICRRLRFSGAETEYVDAIVRHHTRLLPLFNEWRQGRLSARAVARLFAVCRNLSPDLILHAMADMKAKGADDDLNLSFETFGLELIDRFYIHFEPIRSQPPLLTGHDLIERFGLRPSPLFKSLLDQVETARLAGDLTSKQAAERFVREMLDNGFSKSDPVTG